MKVVFLLLFFLVFAESKWIPAQKVEDLPAELQPYIQLHNGKFAIKNGAKIPILFENGQFALKFTKEKCKAGIHLYYSTITGKVGGPFINNEIYKNSTGESEFIIMSNGRNIMNNHEELVQQEAFKLDKDGISFVKFDIRDFDCEVVLSQGKLMVDKAEVKPPVEDAKANVVIIAGSVGGAVVLVVVVGCLVYWCVYRKMKKNEIDVESGCCRIKKGKSRKKDRLPKIIDKAQVSDRTVMKNFKKKRAKFMEMMRNEKFDLAELGYVTDYIGKTGGIKVCSSREGNEESLKMTDVGGTYDFHDVRIMDPLEVRLLKESSKNGSSIVNKLRIKADNLFDSYFGPLDVIPSSIRSFVRNSETEGFYQAALFAKEFSDHLKEVKTFVGLKSMPIQALICKLFDPTTDAFRSGQLLTEAVTLLKCRMLIQFKKLSKDEIKHLQWPMNTYGKWYYENPGEFYLTKTELKSLETKMMMMEDLDLRVEFDIDSIKDLLVESDY
uniref:Uncharacterized protein n=1 Tax=Panagrolaimus sp. JU765 TaxID=591449 RepID=A0AC34RS94_9BILA